MGIDTYGVEERLRAPTHVQRCVGDRPTFTRMRASRWRICGLSVDRFDGYPITITKDRMEINRKKRGKRFRCVARIKQVNQQAI